MSTTTSDRVNFEVGNETLAGVVRRPTDGDPKMGLVLLGPLTSVKEQAPGRYAEALARRGFVTLAFDNRTFGESSGEPRQYEHPPRKVEDALAAAGHLLDEHHVDSVGAVGVCAGAGYMAGAVADGPFCGFAAVAGFFHDAQAQRGWMGEGYQTQLQAAKAARLRYEQTGEAEHIPAVGKGDVAMPLDEAFEYYGTERGAVPNYTNAFSVMSREHTLPWDAQLVAPRIRVPTLMVHSERALAPALARKFFGSLPGHKREVWLESRGQIDFYDDPKLIEPAADEIASHFDTLRH